MEEKRRAIGYICPSCRQPMVETRGAFELAAGPGRLRCACGSSSLGIDMAGPRVHVALTCAFCGGTHTASCAVQAFLQEEVLAFSCPVTGLDCLCAGQERPVLAAMGRLAAAAERLEESAGERGAFLDEAVMQETLEELRDIARRGGISCTCGSRAWRLDVHYSAIDITCADCGGKLRIAAAADDDLDWLCSRDSLLIRGENA